jgi:hypothetical protein
VYFPGPPKTPLPDPIKHPEWYGEVWIQYATSQHPVPLMNGDLQKARFEFGVILNSGAQLLFNVAEGAGGNDQRDSGLLNILANLWGWYSSLPDSLAPRVLSFPSQLKQQYVAPKVFHPCRFKQMSLNDLIFRHQSSLP